MPGTMGRKTELPPPLLPVALTRASSVVTVGAMRDSLSAGHSARPAQGGCAGHGPRPQTAGQHPRRLQGSALTKDWGQLGPQGKTCTSPASKDTPARQGVSVPCSCQLIRKGRRLGGPQFSRAGFSEASLLRLQTAKLLPASSRLPACLRPGFLFSEGQQSHWNWGSPPVISLYLFHDRTSGALPGGPRLRAPRFHCRGPQFTPWSGALRPHKPCSQNKNKSAVTRYSHVL